MTKTQTNDVFIACKESRIENTTSFYGCFYLGPFDESLSQTLANDLRRTLLSELTGLAITSIEIEGVLHKFSSLPGMKESVLNLICNIQNVVLKKKPEHSSGCYAENLLGPSKKTYIGFLKVSGPRIIKAEDLKLPPNLQCVDPNQYIATLAEDGILNMKFNINEGKNYIKQKSHNLDVTVLKKRNILIQNFKKSLTTYNPTGQSNSKNLSGNCAQQPELKRFEAVGTELYATRKTYALSNPIPLDAVFMPVTKVNCIIEENNLYSDFSTDFTTSELKFYEDNQALLGLPVSKKFAANPKQFFDFLNYASIYQSSLFIQNFKTPEPETSSPFETRQGGSQKAQNNKKLTYLFNLSENCAQQPELKRFEAVGTELYATRSNTFYYNLTKTDQVNKIKTFFGSKSLLKYGLQNKRKKIKSSIRSLFYNTEKSIFTTYKLNLSENCAQQPGLCTGKAVGTELYATRSYTKLKTILQKYSKSFRLNKESLLNKQYLNLEYVNILKLKPLRKKSQIIVEIWTNGSIHPREALLKSFSFLANYFIKLQNVKILGSMFNSELTYGNIKTSYFKNYFKNLSKAQAATRKTKPVKATKTFKKKKSITNLSENCKAVGTELYATRKNFYSKKKIFKKNSPEQSSGCYAPQIQLLQPSQHKISLTASVGLLKISLRTYTALKKAGILVLSDLLKKSKKDLLKIENLGAKSLFEIETSLANLGFGYWCDSRFAPANHLKKSQ